ncbi:hypothetical protein C8R44DRAFT_873534 [Mycena epipterygia]|nr:hypothetical protein C8R44DRAFT_873534 [Mycena epipterygia]
MTDHAHSPEKAPSGSTASVASVPSLSSGAFITNSHNFTISGGTFTNVVNNVPAIPSDFRMIPLGDLDLRNEIHLEHSGVVNRRRGMHPARRVYNARIEGKQSDMTVAVYQGENAEETWKRELGKYTGLRHPNIVQLYGAVNSGSLYATIFHDDLVPFEQFIDEYQHSVISTVYLYVYFHTEFDRLSMEDASRLGFPALELETKIWGVSWDESVYAALSRFHVGKGFDPNSQDFAQHLEYRLYKLFSGPNLDSAHIKEVIFSDPSSAQDKPITTIHDALGPRKLKYIVIGTLVLTLIASWSHKYLRRVGE